MLACPYCHERATTLRTKLRLRAGTASRSIDCESCGRRVGLSRWSVVFLIPLLPAIATGHISLLWRLICVSIGVAFYIIAKVFIVPLSRRM